MLNVNQVAFGLDKFVLGATDQRMGVWVQGCNLACPGCSSVHTWSAKKGKQVSVDNLIKLAKMQKTKPAGLTLSGGEPAAQANEVLKFVRAFREAFPAAEVILYTGLAWVDFNKNHRLLADSLDVVIAGPYDHAFSATPLAGSSNQEVKILTELAEFLYHDWKNWPTHKQQLAAGGFNSVVTVGIPDTHRMAKAVDRSGALKVTWQNPALKMASTTIEVTDYE